MLHKFTITIILCAFAVFLSSITSAQKIVESTSKIAFYNKTDNSLLKSLTLNNLQEY